MVAAVTTSAVPMTEAPNSPLTDDRSAIYKKEKSR